MSTKSVKSVEEQVEDKIKKQFGKTKYYTKTESINSEIDNALKTAQSKSGGDGSNFPDIKYLLKTKSLKNIPVMIEVKGTKGKLEKLDANGEIDNTKKDGTPNINNIKNYAANGAVHYAKAIVDHTVSYKEAIAVGVNGYKDGKTLEIEISVYYVSDSNFGIAKKVDNYSDISFLLPKNAEEFVKLIEDINLSDEEKEKKTKEFEGLIELKLKKLNQIMHDDLKISEGSRVGLIAGMIMAGYGVPNKVSPLEISELKGESGKKDNDGIVIINKIDSFLDERKIPDEKKKMIVSDLSSVFLYSNLWVPENGESKLKSVYTIVKNEIMPVFTSAKHLDFTGKLFNILNDWVDIPDSDKNDVVLTPRYVTDMMAKIAQVNMDSYVWDYTVGTAGFLVSAMKEMIKDAEKSISSPKALEKKKSKIKREQLLGVEKRSDIYLLAVLNMILMQDGSSNIIHKDSLLDFEGKYEQGSKKGKKFPANILLLNPPYSALGKGFVFVEKALKKMKSGRAVILIQENAGSGKGLPYTKNILKNNTLVASIHMANIFKDKASVQTAIYVFDVGKKHDTKQIVKFIDFTVDGYTRQNRKKATISTNLRDTDHAKERYEEVINLVLYGNKYLKYFDKNTYIEDTITLEGNDWTFSQHKKIETKPNDINFVNSINDYLSWKATKEISVSKDISFDALGELKKDYESHGGKFISKKAKDYFEIINNSTLNKDSFTFVDYSEDAYPYFTRTIENNGIAGYVSYLDEEHKIKGNVLGVGMLQMKFFYMSHDYYAGQFTKTIQPLFEGFNEIIAQYFAIWFNKSSEKYKSALVRDFDRLFYNTEIIVPIMNNELDLTFICEYMKKVQEIVISKIENEAEVKIKAYKNALF